MSNEINNFNKSGVLCKDCEEVHIQNNTIRNCRDNGIKTMSSESVSILNNRFQKNVQYHIWLNQTSNSEILDNKFDRIIRRLWISKDSESNEVDILHLQSIPGYNGLIWMLIIGVIFLMRYVISQITAKRNTIQIMEKFQ